jgi:hypothetical protein
MPTAYELTRCIVCGHADSSELSSETQVRAELEALWAYHARRLHPDTPPEHLTDRVAFSQRPPIRIVQCNRCGLVYRNPIERASELTDIYERDQPTDAVMRTLHDTQRASCLAQARRLTSVAGRTGSGIEVGSYVGAFLSASREPGWHFVGIDVNACANAFARSLGCEVHDTTLENFDESRQVDAVAIWNCIDQLPDPRSTIRAARTHLGPGGWLAIRAPNGACYAALRSHMSGPLAPIARAWLAQNNLLGFPYRYGFTPGSLGLLLGELGFEVVRVVGDVLVPVADRYTRRWAGLEERLIKAVGGVVARASRGERPLVPWFEIYGRWTMDHGRSVERRVAE